jgi:hypothetical protein
VRIRGDVEHTPEGAKWTGEYHRLPNGEERKIFVEYQEVTELEDIIDPATGGPLYKRGPGGVVLDKKMKRIKQVNHIPRRFIQVDLGNGCTMKQYEPTYLEDPAELERKAREDKRRRFVDKLFEDAEASGELEKILGDDTVDAATPAVRRARRR